jgi:tetratricopeptide (TPR) repeat protein
MGDLRGSLTEAEAAARLEPDLTEAAALVAALRTGRQEPARVIAAANSAVGVVDKERNRRRAMIAEDPRIAEIRSQVTEYTANRLAASDVVGRITRALAYKKLKEYRKAIEDAEAAAADLEVEQTPLPIRLQLALDLALGGQSRYPKTITYQILTDCYEALGDHAMAEKYKRRVLSRLLNQFLAPGAPLPPDRDGEDAQPSNTGSVPSPPSPPEPPPQRPGSSSN